MLGRSCRRSMSAAARGQLDALRSQGSTALSLRELYRVGIARDRVGAASFLHGELPIRMAARIGDLRQLFGRGEVAELADHYERACLELVALDRPSDDASEAAFAAALARLMGDGASVPRTLAAAVRRRHAAAAAASIGGATPGSLNLHPSTAALAERLKFDANLAAFFTARVGLRLLVDHYLALRDPARPPGLLAECRPAALAASAAAEVKALAADAYGAAPAIEIVGDLGASLTYVSGHAEYALLELLKNSARASCAGENRDAPPPIKIIVADGVEDVTIKIADEGGGCPRSTRHSMWSWFWSSGRALGRTGGGLGLPMTRCLARYFGGDLALRPLEGHGTDAYLHLSKLGDRCEVLPRAVAASPANADSELGSVPEALAFFDEHDSATHRTVAR